MYKAASQGLFTLWDQSFSLRDHIFFDETAAKCCQACMQCYYWLGNFIDLLFLSFYGVSVQTFALLSLHFKGELYTWGRDEGDGRLGLGPSRGPSEASGLSIPSKVKALPVPVAAVSCGGFFTMALTKEGQLWNWGGEIPHSILATFYPLHSLSSLRFALLFSYLRMQWILLKSDPLP